MFCDLVTNDISQCCELKTLLIFILQEAPFVLKKYNCRHYCYKHSNAIFHTQGSFAWLLCIDICRDFSVVCYILSRYSKYLKLFMCQLMCTLLIELLIHRCQACTGIGNQCSTLCVHKLISLLSTVCIYPITILRILQQSIHIQESILASFIFGLLRHFIIHISTII